MHHVRAMVHDAAAAPDGALKCPNSYTATESVGLSPCQADESEPSVQTGPHIFIDFRVVSRMDRSVTIDMPRQEYVERSKQRAFDYLDQGDVRNAVASFVGSMNDRSDCRLPHHLAALGVLLLMANDALGWRTLIEGVR